MRTHSLLHAALGCRAALAATLLGALVSAAAARAEIESVDQVLGAIVGVRTQVPAQARTAETLGTERIGSGAIIDTKGLVVTIGYLILEARSAEIMLADGRQLPASIVGYDHDSGFGLLRAIGTVNARPLRLGDSATLLEGAAVLTASFGGPAGVRPATVVSRREFAGYWEYLLAEAIFTTPPHPAYGGAALLGAEGRLLGIGSLAVSEASPDTFAPGNMFVPINLLKAVIGDLLTDGRPTAPARPWLGLFVEESRTKLFVARIAEDGPASRAGLRTGDIILKVAGTSVASMADFYRRVWALGDAGVTVPLTVLSGSELRDFDVRSGDRYAWLRLTPSN